METEEEQHWLVLQCLVGARSGQLRGLINFPHNPDAILAAGDDVWRAAGAMEHRCRYLCQ